MQARGLGPLFGAMPLQHLYENGEQRRWSGGRGRAAQLAQGLVASVASVNADWLQRCDLYSGREIERHSPWTYRPGRRVVKGSAPPSAPPGATVFLHYQVIAAQGFSV
jgi:hypothetical protein